MRGAAASAGTRCTDLSFASTGVYRKNTWLLFLPLFPVRTSTPVVLGIGVSMLLLDIMTLVMLGHLLIFHLYLSTCPQALPPGWPVFAPSCSCVPRQVAPQSASARNKLKAPRTNHRKRRESQEGSRSSSG